MIVAAEPGDGGVHHLPKVGCIKGCADHAGLKTKARILTSADSQTVGHLDRFSSKGGSRRLQGGDVSDLILDHTQMVF